MSLNTRLESNKEEKKEVPIALGQVWWAENLPVDLRYDALAVDLRWNILAADLSWNILAFDLR